MSFQSKMTLNIICEDYCANNNKMNKLQKQTYTRLFSSYNCYRNSTEKAQQKCNQQSQNSQNNQQTLRANKLKKHGLILGNIIDHVESQQFRSTFALKKYIHKHGWCCLHMWMLDHRTRILNCKWNEIPSALWFRWQLKRLIYSHNYSEVDSYTDRTQKDIYFELKRIQKVIYWSFDDYFVYNFREKLLPQIISEDMGLYLYQKDITTQQQEHARQQNMNNIQKYIETRMSQLEATPVRKLVLGDFVWQL